MSAPSSGSIHTESVAMCRGVCPSWSPAFRHEPAEGARLWSLPTYLPRTEPNALDVSTKDRHVDGGATLGRVGKWPEVGRGAFTDTGLQLAIRTVPEGHFARVAKVKEQVICTSVLCSPEHLSAVGSTQT